VLLTQPNFTFQVNPPQPQPPTALSLPISFAASNSRRTKMTLDEMAEADEQLAEVDAHYLGG